MAFIITSSAFSHEGSIPSRYTCEGENISPPTKWINVPDAAQSLALIIDDPDAPDPKAPKMTWVHWVLYNILPAVTDLPENITSTTRPPGSEQGLNDWKRMGYGGPCPPIGRHRYFHKLYALNTMLQLHSPTKVEVEAAMKEHIIAQTELVGTYHK